MKLNPDCIRDILLAVEESTDFSRSLEYDMEDLCPDGLRNYSHDEIVYHIRQCELSGLILGVLYCDDGDHIEIGDLSPDGHKFLANVRQNTIWNKTKTVAEKIGTKSLDALIQISSNVITELIKAQFGLI